MKLAAVCMIKNECDVIELFIRINARVVDHFFVIDDGSSDATATILDHLAREGYPITVSHRQTFGYQQAALTNDAVRKIAALDYDWIMPLDADEFIGPCLKHALNALSEDVPGKLMLRNFIPLEGDYFETRAGFRTLRVETIATAAEWAIAAWIAHAVRAEGFSFVHAMMFHPPLDNARGAAADAAQRLGRLRAGLRLGYRRRRHVSVTYVPGRDRDTRPWHFGSDADPYRALTPAASPDGTSLARELQSSWLDRLTKDIWHG